MFDETVISILMQASLAKRRRDELQPRDERGQRHFPQIGRFLRMFDRIETLRLDDFKNVIRAVRLFFCFLFFFVFCFFFRTSYY